MVAEALFTSARNGEVERDYWRTPPWLIARIVEALGPIGLDPCAVHPSCQPWEHTWPESRRSTVGAKVEWTEGGLEKSWAKKGLVFVNYPYSQSRIWAPKCACEAAFGAEQVIISAARTETVAWKALWKAPRVLLLNNTPDGSRVHFVKPDGTIGTQTPFPSALIYFGTRINRFSLLGDLGQMVMAVK